MSTPNPVPPEGVARPEIALVQKWRASAERFRLAKALGPESKDYGEGRAVTLERCADELEAVLRGSRGQEEHEDQAQMDTMGTSTDSRTASTGAPSATAGAGEGLS